MLRHALGCCLSLLFVGCGTLEAGAPPRSAEDAHQDTRVAQSRPDPEPKPATKRKKKKAVSQSARAEAEERKVDVSGIEGTLTSYDVRETLDKRGKEFARCYTPRARHVPALGGSVQFNIHVLKGGHVRDVHTLRSDLGDRVLERCLGEVIREATFPSPHGGEADVQYQMALEAAESGARTEQWETRRVESVLKKRRSALLSTCDAHRAGPFTVTAYVSRSGRVLAAGVAAPTVTSADTLDCIAEELRSWSMPRPRKAIAKVSFNLRTGA